MHHFLNLEFCMGMLEKVNVTQMNTQTNTQTKTNAKVNNIELAANRKTRYRVPDEG